MYDLGAYDYSSRIVCRQDRARARSAPFLKMAGGSRLLLLWRFIAAVALVQVWSAGFAGE